MHEVAVALTGNRVTDMLRWCMDTLPRESWQVLDGAGRKCEQHHGTIPITVKMLSRATWRQLFMYHPSYDTLILPRYQYKHHIVWCDMGFENEDDAVLFKLTWG